ncbi:MAG TPA: hypothetical protein DCM05_11675 [Elusimicrobia bacterium]|nr:hypothetical protein [Elusimicrobiota bacterium]
MRPLRLALLAAAAFGLWALYGSKPPVRARALVLDAAEAEAACAVSRFPEPEFFERAAAAGVGAMLLKPRVLAAAAQGGELTHFTRGDVEKMRRLGLIGPHSPLKGDSLWSKDKEGMALLERMLKRRGFAASPAEMAGQRGLLLSEGVLPESFRVGYDRRSLQRIRSKGLVPMFLVEDDADMEAAAVLSGEEPSPSGSQESLRGRASGEGPAPAVLLVPASFHGPIAANSLTEILSRGGWAAFADDPAGAEGFLDKASRIRWLEQTTLSPSQTLLQSEIRASEGEAGLRLELARGEDLVLARLDPARGVDWNFERLRPLAASFRGEEGAVMPSSVSGRRALPGAGRLALFALAVLLAAVGPVMAMRKGLDAVRRLSSRSALEQASPLLEAASGLLASIAVCALSGLCVRAALSVREWQLGLFPSGLGTAALFLEAAVGMAALYPLSFRSWGGAEERPMEGVWTRGLLLRAGRVVLFLAAALLIACPAWTEGSAFASLAAAFALRAEGGWLYSRIPEAALGYAALFVGLWSYRVRLGAGPGAGPEEADMRPWLLLGLLSLAGGALSFAGPSAGRAARELSVAGLIGIPLGLVLVGIRGLWRRAGAAD